jgi:hypothetical protein
MDISPEWEVALRVIGYVAPAMQVARDRGRPLSGDEFVDVADGVINVLAAYLLAEDAPPIGVFCLDSDITSTE